MAPGSEDVAAPRPRGWLSWLPRFGLLAALTLFLGLLAYGLLAQAPETGIDDGLARAEPVTAPGFELPVLQRGSPGAALGPVSQGAARDRRVSLAELRGTPIVLNFWASWCVPCRTEAPVLERGWRQGKQRGIAFVGLNMQDLTDDARTFMEEFDNTYLNVRDESSAVALDWGVTGLPETFFISSRGDVAAHVIGALSGDQLEAGMDAAESGQPVGAVRGGARRSVR